MYNHYKGNAYANGCSEKGTIIHTVSTFEILASKNNVDLRAVVMTSTNKVSRYEIYADNEFLVEYRNEKTARKMWKDFSAAA